MKLKRVKLKNLEKYSLCVLKDGQWAAFRAVLDAVPDDGTNERKNLENASDDLIAFLKDRIVLQPKLEELIAIAQTNNAELILDGQDVMPFRPLLYRDFMLCEKHVINSSRGFVKRMMPKAAIVVK